MSDKDKPFKITVSPDEKTYVNCWQYGVLDGLFHFGVGISMLPNEGKILYSFVMTPHHAKAFHAQLGNLLNQNPPSEGKRNLPH